MLQPPRFIYFDLGNVLLHFDHELACRQMAEVSGVAADAVRDLVFRAQDGLQWQYERGEITTAEFHLAYCDALGTDVDVNALARAASDIFRLNTAILPLLWQLQRSGHRLGILSNTCPAHWEFVVGGRFRLITEYFERFALSYELREMKPDAECYRAAEELADAAPDEIFFLDDREENVAGANEAAWSAVRFTSVPQLVRDLQAAGVRLAI